MRPQTRKDQRGSLGRCVISFIPHRLQPQNGGLHVVDVAVERAAHAPVRRETRAAFAPRRHLDQEILQPACR